MRGVAPGFASGTSGAGKACCTVGDTATPAARKTVPQVPWTSHRSRNRLPSCSASTICRRSRSLVSWGHDWVVLCLIVVGPWAPTRVFALPISMRLYRNRQGLTKGKKGQKKPSKPKHTPNHRARPELALQLIVLVAQWFSQGKNSPRPEEEGNRTPASRPRITRPPGPAGTPPARAAGGPRYPGVERSPCGGRRALSPACRAS